MVLNRAVAARQGRLVLTALLLIAGLALAAPGPAASAVEQPTDQESPGTASPAAGTAMPGLDQLVPQAAALNDAAAEITPEGLLPGNLEAVRGELAQIQQTISELAARSEAWGELESWTIGRLLQSRNHLREIDERLQTLLDRLSGPLQDVDNLRETWLAQQARWQEWQQAARQELRNAAQPTFRGAEKTIGRVLERIDQASTRLLNLQQEIAAQQQDVLQQQNRLNQALDAARSLTFRRNAYPLFSSQFLEQFGPGLWQDLLVNLDSVRTVPEELSRRFGPTLVLMLLGALFIGWVLRKRATQPTDVPEDWDFLFAHPWAGGLFVSIFIGSLLTPSPPPLWQWSMAAVGTLTATILICALLERPRLRRVIMILAGLFILSETSKIIGLPQPLFRVYLLLVCLIAAPVCLAAARRQVKRNEGRLDVLAVAFYLGTLAAVIGLLTQILGFATLTTNLVDAALGTVFVALFTHMALHLGEGGIQELMQRDWVRNRRLIQQLGTQTESRLKTLLRLVVIGYAGLYLLVVWNLFDDVSSAWSTLMELEYTVGEFRVSVEMIFLIICVLYLSMILSWIIQATLDTQILEPRRIDRGVKDSIKRLLHYALVLVGFTIALGMAGIGLEKFTILAGALGVGIGFGLQNIVNNFVSGLILLFERPVKVGDSITMDDQWGIIAKIGLRSTIVETLDRSEIIVPNSDLISEKVINWTHTSGVSRVTLPVGVEYGTELAKVIEILKRVGDAHPEVLKDPKPSAIFTGFGDSSIDFELRVWIADISQRLRIRSELGQAVDQGFREAGITIPFPQRDLHLRSIESNLHSLLQSKPGAQPPRSEGQTE